MGHCAPALPTSASDILARIGAMLGGRSDLELEFSIRIRHGIVDDRGRFAIWCGPDDAGMDQMAAVIRCHGAPARVCAELRNLDIPVRSGFGVSVTPDGPDYRLYLHDRSAATAADRYRAWTWRPSVPAHSAVYAFHYFPETVEGERPEELIAPEFRQVLDALFNDDRLRPASGFWLRRRDRGPVDQLDLTFPWSPPAGSIPGLVDFVRRLGGSV